MSSKDKEKKNEGTSQVPVQPQEKVDSSPQINETNATTESTAITKYDLTNDPIAQRLSNKPKAIATPTQYDLTNDPIAQRLSNKPKTIATPTQESYAIAPPPQEPDYDAIEKGIEDKDKEQRKADANRRRSRAIVSAIGDGLSALSNLYFTTRYAPNMNTGRGELSAKNVERWDKYVKARDAKLAEYKKTAIERADKKYKSDYTRWKDEATFAQNKRKQDMEEAKSEFEMALKRAKDERDSERNYWLNLKTQKEIDGIEYDNRISEIDAKYEEDIKKAELAYKRAQERLASTGAQYNIAKTNKTNKESYYVGKNNGSNRKSNYVTVSRENSDGTTSEEVYYEGSPGYNKYMNKMNKGNKGGNGSNISMTDIITHDEPTNNKKKVKGFGGAK